MSTLCNNKTSRLNSPRKLLAVSFQKFKKSQSGAASVEFALVAIPFFVLMFSIFEQGSHFLAHRLIDAGVNSAARQIRTHQITGANTTPADFKTALCSDPFMFLFDCAKLKVDVRELARFENPDAPPVNQDGSLDDSGFGFSPGQAQSINIIRAYYDWPTVLDWRRMASMNPAGANDGWTNYGNSMGEYGYKRIVGTAAFMSEPN